MNLVVCHTKKCVCLICQIYILVLKLPLRVSAIVAIHLSDLWRRLLQSLTNAVLYFAITEF